MSDMSREPYIVALIPARAGSKGVPGKNIMALNNRAQLYLTARRFDLAIADATLSICSWVSARPLGI